MFEPRNLFMIQNQLIDVGFLSPVEFYCDSLRITKEEEDWIYLFIV